MTSTLWNRREVLGAGVSAATSLALGRAIASDAKPSSSAGSLIEKSASEIAAMIREGDGWITNVHQGGMPLPAPDDPELEALAKTLRGVALFWASVNQAPPPPRKA